MTRRRDHFWDAMRALLMLLGIPYHVALAYRAGHQWIVSPGEGLNAFTRVAEFIHLFRMPGFFLIAGYFAALLLSRRAPDDWLQGRLLKLAPPLVASLLVLVPVLNIVCELSTMPWPDAVASWKHNSATSGGYWVRHLWFIIVLLYCSTAAALLAWSRPALRHAKLPARIDAWIADHFAWALAGGAVVLGLWEAVAVELFYIAGLATNLPQQILRLDELITYAPYFASGCLLARSPKTLERAVRFVPAVALMALASTTISLVYVDSLWAPVGRFFGTISGIALTQSLIVGAKAFLDRPIPLVQRLVEASFVIYLVHMPIVVMLVLAGKYVTVPVAVKAATVMLLTLALSYSAWLIVERSGWLRFLFNGDAMPRRQVRLGHQRAIA
ncbi:glucans biosynthesis protein MdoC [soil metagenome]